MHSASDKTGARIRLYKTNPSYLNRSANALRSIVSVVFLIYYRNIKKLNRRWMVTLSEELQFSALLSWY